MKWLRIPKKRTVLLVIIIILVLVLRNAAVNIGLLARSQPEIVFSFYMNQKQFVHYAKTAISVYEDTGIKHFSMDYDVYDNTMHSEAYDKREIIKAALEADAESMRQIMPFESLGLGYYRSPQVKFRLKHERGVIYVQDGDNPIGDYFVYTKRIANNWYYYEENHRKIIKEQSLG